MKNIKKSDMLAEIQLTYKNKINKKDRIKIKSEKDAIQVLRNIYDKNTIDYIETATVLLLNNANEVLGWCQISTGGTNATIVDSKVIFQLCLNSNAASFILCHNHPSGNINPSENDIDITKKLKSGAKILDIAFHDHIIISSSSHNSLSKMGYLI